MKKTYSKPDIFYEDFSLNESIAAGCKNKVNSTDGECGYIFAPGITLFSVGIDDCDIDIISGQNEQYDCICYHNPSNAYSLFNS